MYHIQTDVAYPTQENKAILAAILDDEFYNLLLMDGKKVN